MKLAEAANLRESGDRPPILLLDDVMSELDAGRRAHVLEQAADYRQAFITHRRPQGNRPPACRPWQGSRSGTESYPRLQSPPRPKGRSEPAFPRSS